MPSIKANRAGRPSSLRRGESRRRISLTETLDRVLNKGAVVVGDVILSVAGIELVYIGVNLVLCSVETMRSATGVHKLSPPPERGAFHASR